MHWVVYDNLNIIVTEGIEGGYQIVLVSWMVLEVTTKIHLKRHAVPLFQKNRMKMMFFESWWANLSSLPII